MSSVYVLVWLGPLAAQAALQPDLDSWAHARLARLSAPVSNSSPAARYDDALVDQVETELEQARVAAGSLDLASMRQRLRSVERALHGHPELPQAAWLMAERLSIEARAIESDNPEETRRLEARARTLEGKRAAAFGATESPSTPATDRKIALDGLTPHDRIYVDGLLASTAPTLAMGEHHVRVVRRGRPVFSTWVTVAPSTSRLSLAVPPPQACSRDDLGAPRIRGDRVIVGAGVQCSRWIAARPRSGGGIEVATCAGSWCGPFQPWTRRSGSIYDGPPQPASADQGFPEWAAWLVAGAATATVTGVVLWRAGVFDGPEPGGTKYTFTGPR